MFLVKRTDRRDKLALMLCEESALVVSYPEKHRHLRTNRVGGIAFRTMEGTGEYDKSTIQVYCGDEAQRADGSRASTPRSYWKTATTADHCRRLQREDAEVIAAIDAEVEEAKARLRDVKAKREQAVVKAWRNARRSVTISEIAKRADARLAEWQKKKAAAGLGGKSTTTA